MLTSLRTAGLRAEIDARSERMNAKIRDAQLQKIPYMLVVGDREAEAQAVSVRTRAGEDLKSMPVFQFIDRLQDEVATDRHEAVVLVAGLGLLLVVASQPDGRASLVGIHSTF